MADGKHLINGEWVAGDGTFANAPASGPARAFARGSAALIAQACAASEAAFPVFAATPRKARAAFLRRIAEEIDARGDAITAAACAESALPEARIVGERGRTTGQLRLFADHIEQDAWLDRRHDAALPDRKPLPRPELKLIPRPIGPVAVFGASNFPLAFSTAGGDTASALAAGCPVVVKGHEAHPATAELVAEAILAAIIACDMPRGVFSLVHGGDTSVGAALVQAAEIRAVGFTGGLRGGRALFDLCAARPEPIPFFGELGSVNPCFLLPAALAARAEGMAQGWAASLTMGAGQFCTNPGLVIAIDGADVDTFAKAAESALQTVTPQTMLTDGIATAFRKGRDQIAANTATRPLVQAESAGRNAAPAVYEVAARDFIANPDLAEEVFGPLGLIIRARHAAELREVALSLHGQLTATLHLEAEDHPLAATLLPVLERKAGRILCNGWPTGVEVADAMVHSGPYPASTNFGATSVGTMAIRRWLRPVCFQNLPDALLPDDWG